MNTTHLKAVVWKDLDHKSPETYRYTIIGVITSDKPLDGFDESETVIKGRAWGLKNTLEIIPKLPIHSPNDGDLCDVHTFVEEL